MSALRSKADAQSARVRIELMSAFPKADVQNVGILGRAYGRFWPIADIRALFLADFRSIESRYMRVLRK